MEKRFLRKHLNGKLRKGLCGFLTYYKKGVEKNEIK